MSNQMKILSGVAGVVLLAAVVLTMFGKPPNLPLGPLQGMLASEETTPIDTATGSDLTGGLPANDCVDAGADLGVGAGADAGAGAGAGTTPGAVDPVTGLPTDAAAGGAGAGTGTDPAAGGTDPVTGAPVAAPGEGWDGGARVTAAAAGDYDPSRVSDTRIVAAEAVDPVTGLPATDPTATDATNPATGAAGTDPAATGAVDPVTGAPTDAAAGGAGATGAADPCATDAAAGGVADPLGATGTDPLADTGGAPAGGGNAAAGAGAAASTTDGTNSGNSPEALRAAKDATSVMSKAKINVTTTASLVPSAGGVAKGAALRRYRAGVTGAVLVMKLDSAAMQQWTSAGKKVQTDLVKSFITRLGKSYAKASRSVTIVDDAGNVLAIGDAAPRGRVAVKLY